MSKSYGNDIRLADSPAVTTEKIRKMFTDPQKVRKNDPGRPEICPVYTLHRRYSEPDFTARVDTTCRTGELGCVECKTRLAEHVNRHFEPLRERRTAWADRPDDVWDVLSQGAARARERAGYTMAQVRRVMHLA